MADNLSNPVAAFYHPLNLNCETAPNDWISTVLLLLSDADRELTNALRLPAFTVGKQVLLKRLGWIAMDGKIIKTFYPVFPPDRHAQEMLTWLADQNIQGVGRSRAV
ncbi:MAG: hypothetical protein H7Y37_11450 [Anaerolineae bacterium]|nr:hypothetical protein [Gloeobacterales cyanobacterium ES-bin-313]